MYTIIAENYHLGSFSKSFQEKDIEDAELRVVVYGITENEYLNFMVNIYFSDEPLYHRIWNHSLQKTLQIQIYRKNILLIFYFFSKQVSGPFLGF